MEYIFDWWFLIFVFPDCINFYYEIIYLYLFFSWRSRYVLTLKMIETKSQKVLEDNSYVVRSYRAKTGWGHQPFSLKTHWRNIKSRKRIENNEVSLLYLIIFTFIFHFFINIYRVSSFKFHKRTWRIFCKITAFLWFSKIVEDN